MSQHCTQTLPCRVAQQLIASGSNYLCMLSWVFFLPLWNMIYGSLLLALDYWITPDLLTTHSESFCPDRHPNLGSQPVLAGERLSYLSFSKCYSFSRDLVRFLCDLICYCWVLMWSHWPREHLPGSKGGAATAFRFPLGNSQGWMWLQSPQFIPFCTAGLSCLPF